MRDCEQLVEEGRRLLAAVRADCRDERLADTFTGGFGTCSHKVENPCERVDAWTGRAVDTIVAVAGPDSPDLAAIPTRPRKSLETDAGYAARCLKERLAALEHAMALAAPLG